MKLSQKTALRLYRNHAAGSGCVLLRVLCNTPVTTVQMYTMARLPARHLHTGHGHTGVPSPGLRPGVSGGGHTTRSRTHPLPAATAEIGLFLV